VLPLEAFNRRTASPDGRMARCRACDSEYKKAHCQRHLERHREYDRHRYRGERRERILAATRARYLANPEKWNADRRAKWATDPVAARAKQNAYKAAHPELVREWKRRHYERHGEAIRAKERDRHLQNPEKKRRAALDWQRANPELAAERNHRYRARKLLAALGDITLELLTGKLAYWGGRCWMCGGEPTGWDHVKPLAKGGAHVLANLRPACRRCNSSKKDRWDGPTPLLIRRQLRPLAMTSPGATAE
jgi:5-methylcytosine-specific restriction endonuclease McrA